MEILNRPREIRERQKSCSTWENLTNNLNIEAVAKLLTTVIPGEPRIRVHRVKHGAGLVKPGMMVVG